MPKGATLAAMPNALPPETVEVVLAESIAWPTLGVRRLLQHLGERDVVLSASGVRWSWSVTTSAGGPSGSAALAQITAARSGLLTEAAKEGPFGLCHFVARPGDLVALDTFYAGKLKDVGTVWQLTAIDTAPR